LRGLETPIDDDVPVRILTEADNRSGEPSRRSGNDTRVDAISSVMIARSARTGRAKSVAGAAEREHLGLSSVELYDLTVVLQIRKSLF